MSIVKVKRTLSILCVALVLTLGPRVAFGDTEVQRELPPALDPVFARSYSLLGVYQRFAVIRAAAHQDENNFAAVCEMAIKGVETYFQELESLGPLTVFDEAGCLNSMSSSHVLRLGERRCFDLRAETSELPEVDLKAFSQEERYAPEQDAEGNYLVPQELDIQDPCYPVRGTRSFTEPMGRGGGVSSGGVGTRCHGGC